MDDQGCALAMTGFQRQLPQPEIAATGPIESERVVRAEISTGQAVSEARADVLLPYQSSQHPEPQAFGSLGGISADRLIGWPQEFTASAGREVLDDRLTGA